MSSQYENQEAWSFLFDEKQFPESAEASELFFRDLVGWPRSVTEGSRETDESAAEAWPRSLVLLDHFHKPRTPNPSSPGTFTTGSVTKLTAAHMNPGFVNAADALITDTSSTGLHHCLSKMLKSRFSRYLRRRGAAGPSKRDELAVALVDLSGRKLSTPDFAGWGSTVAYYGASTPKILPVYAVHQLRADLRHLATTESITDPAALRRRARAKWRASGLRRGFPSLRWLFDFSGSPDLGNLRFSANTTNVFTSINANDSPGKLILKIGFAYIASATVQTGLFHQKRGGLWLRKAYGASNGKRWRNNPVWRPLPLYVHNATALSAATFFTLLAQGRLVDPATSTEIRNVLSRGCRTNWFPSSLNSRVTAAKCGYYRNWFHDATLIEHGSYRFVSVLFTKGVSSSTHYEQIINGMNRLTINNNRTPKVAC